MDENVGYGYESDEVKVNPISFGLNAGAACMKKFEWIPNGGVDGAAQEALDIVFEVNGKKMSYRRFPYTQGFKDGKPVTDPNAKEYKDGFKEWNAVITHIAHAFMSDEVYKTGISIELRKEDRFKHFCQTVANLLPKNFADIPLDIFLHFQWNISKGQNRTFLEIPEKMKHGRWLSKAKPVDWREVRKKDVEDGEKEALFYFNPAVGENGLIKDEKTGKMIYEEKHSFIRTGWFMNNNFAKQQTVEGEEQQSAPTNNGEGNGESKGLPATGATVSTW